MNEHGAMTIFGGVCFALGAGIGMFSMHIVYSIFGFGRDEK